MNKPDLIAVDIETQPHSLGKPDPYQDKLLLTAVVADSGEEWLFEGERLPEWFLDWLADEDVLKLAHNMAFEAMFFQRLYGLRMLNVWDTLGIERLLTAGMGYACDLNAVSERRLARSLQKGIRDHFAYGIVGDEEREYCLNDARVLLPIYRQQQSDVELGNHSAAAEMENAMSLVVADMRVTGIGFDKNLWEEYLELSRTSRMEIMCQVWDKMGFEYTMPLFGEPVGGISLTSRDRVLAALGRMGVDLPNYQAGTLQKYVFQDKQGADVVRLLLEFKKWDKALGWSWPDDVHPVTGRIHPDFNPQGAETFRFSSSKPNMQQVSRPWESVNWRHLFTAAPGKIFVGADYSQIELRLIAEATGEEEYVRCFQDGLDMHTLAAEKLLGRPIENKEERDLGKTYNFAVLCYGGGPGTLAGLALSYGIYLSEAQARDYIQRVRGANPSIEQWGKEQYEKMTQEGFLQTPCGHRRNFLFEDRVTVALNTPIQMWAAGIMKDALQRIYLEVVRRDLPMHFVLQIHDEGLWEVPIGFESEATEVVERHMIEAGEYWVKEVPIEVSSYVSRTWEKF